MKFIPTPEQLTIARQSHLRYMLSLRAIFYSPREWAVMCLANEYVTGGRVNW